MAVIARLLSRTEQETVEKSEKRRCTSSIWLLLYCRKQGQRDKRKPAISLMSRQLPCLCCTLSMSTIARTQNLLKRAWVEHINRQKVVWSACARARAKVCAVTKSRTCAVRHRPCAVGRRVRFVIIYTTSATCRLGSNGTVCKQ